MVKNEKGISVPNCVPKEKIIKFVDNKRRTKKPTFSPKRLVEKRS